jgi:nucleotide-binding universal stress UspA family protein
MPGQEHAEGERIVAGVDGSASSLEALRWAVRQAELTGATVDAVIAWQYPAAAVGFGWGAIADDTDYAEWVVIKHLRSRSALWRAEGPVGLHDLRP